MEIPFLEREIINRTTVPVLANEIIREVPDAGFRESDVRATVWNLISRGDLNLRRDWTVQAAAEHPRQLFLIEEAEFDQMHYLNNPRNI